MFLIGIAAASDYCYLYYYHSNYARKQNASHIFAIIWASVRPSVCHTRGLYQNGAS